MAGTSSIDGVVTGMKSSDLITQMLEIDSKPMVDLQTKKTKKSNKINVWKQVTANLLSFKLDAYSLSREALFSGKTISSSDKDVLDASVSGTPIDGSYSIVVNKLAQAHQMLSRGYDDQDSTAVGSGSVTFEFGKGNLNPKTKLDFLNGQNGVHRGSIKITDSAGSSSVVDLSNATEVQEVINAINTNSAIAVTASLNAYGNGINIVDTGAGAIKIEEVNGGSMANDLGIKKTGVGSITGDVVNYVNAASRLSLLNDGTGVRTVAGNDIKISMIDNTSVDIDLTGVTSLEGVITAINSANGNLSASLVDDGNGNNVLKVIDSSVPVADGKFSITALNGSKALYDLGLDGVYSGGNTMNGKRLISGMDTVMLKNLHGGSANDLLSGVDLSNDMVLTLHNNDLVTISSAGIGGFGSSSTIDELLTAINSDPNALLGKFSAEAVTDENGVKIGIKINDLTVGGGTLSIEENATTDSITGLGISVAGTTDLSIDGRELPKKTGIDLSKDLSFTLHSGSLTITSDKFNASETLQELITNINDNSTGKIRAELNDAGNGIQIVDLTSGSSSFSIASNATTNAATGLSIANAGTSNYTIKGADLDTRYISENTLLTGLNSGAGVHKGQIKMTNKNGNSVIIDLSADYIKTIGDVITKINTEGSAFLLSAAVNSTGDGIIITDKSGGSNNLVIDNYGGSMANDLNIAGNATGITINGAYEYTINVAATDKLKDIRDKINNANINVKASIINDGSVSGAFKLMITSKNSGEAGQIVFDANVSGGAGLSMGTIANAQNAVFSLGTQGIGSTPKLIEKSSNTINDVLAGVTINLKSVSSTPVTLSLSNNNAAISTAVQSFVDSYNSFINMVNEKTAYDPETKVAGELQGDYTINQIKNDVFNMLTNTVSGLPSTMNNIGEVGLSFGLDGTLNLDNDLLSNALNTNLEGVKKLFTYSVNVASASNGATSISNPATPTAPYTTAGAIDGNTSFEDFVDGSTGWKAPGGTGTYLQINLASKYKLQKFQLYSLDTSDMPAASNSIKSFDFDYWDFTSNAWKTEKSYSGNASGNLVYYFSSPIITNKIRINNALGNGDGTANITELEVSESRGIGKRIDDLISTLTDVTNGNIVLETDSIHEELDVLDKQISVWGDRLAVKEQQYRDQFSKMESVMQQFKSTSNWLGTQFANLSTGN
ncbi:MAG: hypothetical protein DKM50_03905 [Candidatus Margulisiibacteriota bacterium]|nr:MAG: hypothetical protein DKM50_03905 [Candidatus Margulisiibacteriota bacterium]HCY36989.1 hypothetical protein [Candidatus Margulisiibacteriota bacterium]